MYIFVKKKKLKLTILHNAIKGFMISVITVVGGCPKNDNLISVRNGFRVASCNMYYVPSPPNKANRQKLKTYSNDSLIIKIFLKPTKQIIVFNKMGLFRKLCENIPKNTSKTTKSAKIAIKTKNKRKKFHVRQQRSVNVFVSYFECSKTNQNKIRIC